MTGPPIPRGSPPSSAHCPACERFIGPVTECPYCGTEPGGRLPLRLLRWGALVFGVGGLLLLLVAVRRTDLPLVKAADIVPSMNYGRVRILGTVATEPRVLDKKGVPDYASFEIDDGTGRIVVAASHRTARGLVTGSLLPARGDRIEAAGSLSLAPNRRARLYLDSPAQLKRLGAPAASSVLDRPPHPQTREEA
ncbi:MAG: hypothetical protein WCS01_10990 [bacterium]